MSTTTTNNNNEIIYRAHSLGRRKRSPAYEEAYYTFVDLWELHVTKHPIRSENYRWHLRNLLEPHIVTVDEDDRVTIITSPRYFSESAAEIGSSQEYFLLPSRLIKRRFLGPVLQFDVDSYISENTDDPNIIFIHDPIPGISPVREILVVTRQEQLMHEVVADSNPESDSKSEYDKHNYSITFTPVNCRSKLDCSLHFGEVRHIDPPETVILGYSLYDPEVIKLQKKQAIRRKHIRQLKFMKAALETMQVMNLSYQILDVDTDPTYLRALALEELEKGGESSSDSSSDNNDSSNTDEALG